MCFMSPHKMQKWLGYARIFVLFLVILLPYYFLFYAGCSMFGGPQVTGQLADMPTRRLDDSRTGYLVDWSTSVLDGYWTSRGLVNS